jgi:hypothetical protein
LIAEQVSVEGSEKRFGRFELGLVIRIFAGELQRVQSAESRALRELERERKYRIPQKPLGRSP